MRNKAADTARMSKYSQSELGQLLPTTSTTKSSGQTSGITLTEDEQAAAQLYAIGNLLQGNAGAMSPLTPQQQAAAYAAGGSSSNVIFNSPTSLVNRRAPATDDGEPDRNHHRFDLALRHRRRSSVKFRRHDIFAPKICMKTYQNTRIFIIFARKINKQIPNFT